MASGKAFIGKKIHEVMAKGIRRNTRKPVSKANPRRKVSRRRAVAVALNVAREKGYSVPKKKR